MRDYAPKVNIGNKLPLAESASDFAQYLNRMHQQLHPIFADSYLASLDSLPKDNPLQNPELTSEIEMVIDERTGELVQEGLIKSSGNANFDAAVLASMASALPVVPVPPAAASSDGRVYIHWELHRNPDMACSTWFAYPYKLKF